MRMLNTKSPGQRKQLIKTRANDEYQLPEIKIIIPRNEKKSSPSTTSILPRPPTAKNDTCKK